MLQRNVGGLDRGVRLALGVLLFPADLSLLGGLQGRLIGLAAAAVGLLGLATAATGFCLLYAPLRISTVKRERRMKMRLEGGGSDV